MSQTVLPEYNDLHAIPKHEHRAHAAGRRVVGRIRRADRFDGSDGCRHLDRSRAVEPVVAALGIATFKGSLVVLYFMHLKYDSPFNGLIFVAALAFLTLFLLLVLLDASQYQPDIQSYRDALSLR